MDATPIYINPGEQNVEQQITIVLAGNTLNARQRLMTALQVLEYHIISDTPLRARRAARNGGQSHLSANILDYQCKLEIHLFPLTQYATQVTFDYEIHEGRWVTPQPTLAREAEAIIAVAQRLAQKPECTSCGTLLKGESRYCRK